MSGRGGSSTATGVVLASDNARPQSSRFARDSRGCRVLASLRAGLLPVVKSRHNLPHASVTRCLELRLRESHLPSNRRVYWAMAVKVGITP